MAYTLVDHNDDFVIVNKHPGITVQRDGDSPGLLELAAAALGYPKLYPVHRLDKATSGLVIMAITEEANRLLSGMFAKHLVQKHYLAISDHKPKKKQGAISGDMEKSRRGSWKLLKTHKNPALTQFFSLSLLPGKRIFLLRPKTGKTHQLRVALKSIGAPILGDIRYGSAGELEDRMYLHAWQLAFEWRNERLSYRSPPESGLLFAGEGYELALSQWQNPEELSWPKR
ncbi:MAG: TIGR01621 family pseudouridine synthase [Cellvibrionaceae bacterium]|nr:TIGR01621 family pseudouridine synthase [Cellvibrionaceae bacterium]